MPDDFIKLKEVFYEESYDNTMRHSLKWNPYVNAYINFLLFNVKSQSSSKTIPPKSLFYSLFYY